MNPLTKSDFLAAYGFPGEWLEWDLYPDSLFERQRAECVNDKEPRPDEHLRYGVFGWWLHHRSLPEATLKQLARLAALDSDGTMGGAAAKDILCHPCATDGIADELARLSENHPGWQRWAAQSTPHAHFHRILHNARQSWALRDTLHRIVKDIESNQLSIKEEELRQFFATRSPLRLRLLVEHPGLPTDLLLEMTATKDHPFAKEIRTIAKLRLEGRPIPRSTFIEKYSKDPWRWTR